MNNYVFFVAGIGKLANKKVLADSEISMKKKAVMIAALSSNHSWKTHKYLCGISEGMDKGALAGEAAYAFKEGWKNINEADIEEVVNGSFSQHALSMWMYYVVDESFRDEYQNVYNNLKKEFAYGLEPIERRA